MIKSVSLLFIITILIFSSSVMAKTFDGVDYTIIDATRMRNIKCSLDIRLDKKVSKDVLRKLALKLRDDESKSYDRMFITYYLPDMTPGTGAWATSHFNPNLEVKILGLTTEEEKKLKNNTTSSTGSVIGKWLDDSPYLGGTTIIMRENGKINLTQTFKDGSVLKKEMTEKRQGSRTRYNEKGGSSHGEYYLIESGGTLGLYDGMGLIKTLRPIK